MITRFQVATTAASPPTHWHRLAWGVAAFLLSANTAWAVPQGGEIVAGDGNISMSDSRTMNIFQGSHSLAIDWSSFNVALNERVVFQQPSSTASALNRIFDQNPSQIFGVIDANGRVFLLNPNGMVFGRSAQINLQSLVASSLDMSVEDFMGGNYTLEALADQKGGLIVNRGTITAADGGSIVLLGNAVNNEGVLVANQGSVNLAAGRSATLDFTGEGLMLFSLDEGALENESGLAAQVHNSGQIVANGGQVLLTASSASDVLSSVVNNTGVVRAGRIDDTGGVIRLVASGGSAVNSGHLLTQGLTADDTGGSISVLGDSVSLRSGAVLDASGPAGGGDVRIGGDFHGAGELQTAQFTDVEAGVTIAANAEVQGDGGTVVVWSDDTTTFRGDINVQGGQLSGDGGLVEISGKQHLVFDGHVDGRAANGRFGSLLIDPGTVTVCHENGTTCVQGALDRFTDFQIEALLATVSTTISTAVDGVAGDLDIIFEDHAISISWGTASIFGLFAGRNVMLDGTINATGAGALSILFGQKEAGVFTLASTASLTAADIDVTGGDFGNVFNIGAWFLGDLVGGSGTDSFILADGATLDGRIDGGAGTDTLDWSAYTTARAVMLTGVGATDGVDGDESSITGGFNNIDVLTGGMAGDDLTGANVATTWNLAGMDGGTVDLGSDLTDDVAFSSIENLTGGTAADDFMFADGAMISGSIDGGLGSDTLDWSAYTTARAVMLTAVGVMDGVAGMEASITGGFDNIDALLGSGVGGDSLTGVDSGATANWTLADELSSDSLYVNGTATVGFRGFETLLGTDIPDDTFTFLADSNVGILVDGGAGGTDVVNYTAVAAAVDVDLGTQLTNIETLMGNGGDLTGGDAGNDWILDGPAAGTVDDSVVVTTFMNFINLFAGDGGDDFNVNAGVSFGGNVTGGIDDDRFIFADGATISGSIDGGLGTDTLDWSAYMTARAVTLATVGVMDGVAGMEASITGGFDNIDVLTGGMAGDSLAGPNAATTWNLAGMDDGTVDLGSDMTDEVAFSAIENLTGGTLADDFKFADGATISGSIDGGLGTDTLDWSAYMTARAVTLATVGVMDGVAGMEASITGGFDNIDVLTGGMAGDSLAGPNAATTWNVSVADDGTVDLGSDMTDEVAFSAIENLTGGTLADDFKFADGATISGSIDGGLGTDTLDWSAYMTARAVTLTTVGSMDGVAGMEASITGGFDNIDVLTGGMAGDSLAGPNAATTWNVSVADDGTVDLGSDMTDEVAFSAIENLTGGTLADDFKFADGATISGSIDGGAGTDTLDWSAYMTARAVTLTGVGATDGVDGDEASITGGFDNIDVLTGGMAGDSLAGPNAATTWNVSVADDGTVDLGSDMTDDVAFSAIENLTGGTAADDFKFADGATISGSIDGGLGTDTLDWSAYTTARAVTLTGVGATDGVDGDEASITGGFDNIDVLTGGMAGDSLAGPNAATTWNVSGMDDGTVDLGSDMTDDVTFSSFEDLIGGTDADDFVFGAVGTLSGLIDGMGGADTANWAAVASGLTVTLGADVINVETLIGGDSGATSDFTLAGGSDWDVTGANDGTVDTITFADFGNLTGTAGDDSFAFTGGGTITGAIDGGDQTTADEMDVSGATGVQMVDLMAGTAGALLGTFTAIESFVGDAADTLTNGSSWTIDGTDAGTVDGFDFSGFGNLSGTAGADSFTLAGGTVTGTIDGSGGADELTADNVANDWTITAADAGTVTGIGGGFTGIENLTGNSMMDTFTVQAALSGTASGGDGDDTFDIRAGGSAGAIDGGADNDAFNIRDGGMVGEIYGGAGMDELIGGNSNRSWYIEGPDTGRFFGVGAFTGIENLTGGAGNDQFYLFSGGSVSGTIDGGAGDGDLLKGDDRFNAWVVSSTNAGTLNGGAFVSIERLFGGSMIDVFELKADLTGGAHGVAGDDVFHLAGGSVGYAYDGGDGIDILIGDDIANSWYITGTDSGWLNSALFIEIENLSGGLNTDSFILSGGTLTGTIDGRSGKDQLRADNVANTWLISGANTGTVTGVGDGFVGIEHLTGGSMTDNFTLAGGTVSGVIDGGTGTDELTADDSANTWVVTAADAGSVTGVGVGFVGIEYLTGGSMTDTFDIQATLSGTAAGGAGNDVFTINGGGATIDGGTGIDELIAGNVANTWLISAPDAGSVTGVSGFARVENLTGGANTDRFILAGGTVTGTIDGGSGADELIADNVANNWQITAADAGSVTGVNFFVDIENLTGGSMEDRFYLFATLSGTAFGGDDHDWFGIIGGSAGLIDGGAGPDQIVGQSNVANTFVVDQVDAGTLNGTQNFTGIETLWGGSMADTFYLQAALSRFAAGGLGNDVFIINGGSAGLSGGLIDGGAGSDTLIGDDTVNAWVMERVDEGRLNGTQKFNHIENLTGGSMADTFDLSAALSGTAAGGAGNDAFIINSGSAGLIDGGAGNDTLTGDDTDNAWIVNLVDAGTLNVTQNFAGIENLTGGSMADTFDLSAALSGTAAGGAGNDSFIIDGGSAGLIDGGAGNDTLTGDDTDNAWIVNLVDAGTLNVTQNFAGIENLIGGSMADTFDLQAALSGFAAGGAGNDVFTINGGGTRIEGGSGTDELIAGNVANTWLISAADAGSVTGVSGFIEIENLTGGANTDRFILSGGTLSGTIDGESGIDELIGDNVDNIWVISAANSGSVTGVGAGFTGIESLTGGSMVDTFDMHAMLSGTAAGEGGDDTFFINDGASIGGIDGGVGTDELSYAFLSSDVRVSLTDTDAEGFIGSGNGINDVFVGIDVLRGSGGTNDILNCDCSYLHRYLQLTAGGAVLEFSGFESILNPAAVIIGFDLPPVVGGRSDGETGDVFGSTVVERSVADRTR